MSGRSCSLACAVSFPRDVVTSEEAPERADAEVMALFGETGLDLHERDVAGPVHQRQDQIGLRFDTVGMSVAALRFGPRASGVAVERAPANRARRADAEPLGRLPTGHAARNRRNNAFTQIEREGLDMHAGLLGQHAA